MNTTKAHEVTEAILINETHLGPFARPKHARELVRRLNERGLIVAYTPRISGLRWSFKDHAAYMEFEIAFENEIEAMTGAASYWMVEYPCEDDDCDCGGRVCTPAIVGSYYVDFEEAAGIMPCRR